MKDFGHFLIFAHNFGKILHMNDFCYRKADPFSAIIYKIESTLQVQQMTPVHVESVRLAASCPHASSSNYIYPPALLLDQRDRLKNGLPACCIFPDVFCRLLLHPLPPGHSCVAIGGPFRAVWQRFASASGFCSASTGFGFCSFGWVLSGFRLCFGVGVF